MGIADLHTALILVIERRPQREPVGRARRRGRQSAGAGGGIEFLRRAGLSLAAFLAVGGEGRDQREVSPVIKTTPALPACCE